MARNHAKTFLNSIPTSHFFVGPTESDGSSHNSNMEVVMEPEPPDGNLMEEHRPIKDCNQLMETSSTKDMMLIEGSQNGLEAFNR